MKVNDGVRNMLIKNLESKKNDMKNIFDFYIDRIKESKSVEEIMEYKKGLIIYILQDIPLSSDNCYFCLLTGFYKSRDLKYWEGCLYSKYHKVCSDCDSDYGNITYLKCELINKVGEHLL